MQNKEQIHQSVKPQQFTAWTLQYNKIIHMLSFTIETVHYLTITFTCPQEKVEAGCHLTRHAILSQQIYIINENFMLKCTYQ